MLPHLLLQVSRRNPDKKRKSDIGIEAKWKRGVEEGKRK